MLKPREAKIMQTHGTDSRLVLAERSVVLALSKVYSRRCDTNAMLCPVYLSISSV